MLHKLVIILCCNLISTYVDSATYVDQRQSGDLNVQVDLKDLHIIALMKGNKEEYVDYDYAYDYSEMTIKPQNGSTTPKPLNVTSTTALNLGNNSTSITNTTQVQNTTITLINNNSQTEQSEMQNASANESTTTTKSINVETTAAPVSSDGWNSSKNETITTILPNPTNNNSTNCKKGFLRNEKGECQIKLQATGNALIKLVKLSQKLKLRRENRNEEKDSPSAH